MQKSRTLFAFKFIFCIFLFLFLIRIFTVFFFTNKSVYSLSDSEFVGVIKNYYWEDDVLNIEISTSSEVLKGTYELDSKSLDIDLGDLVLTYGTLSPIRTNSVFYAFNYKEYAKRHNQYYSLKINSLQIIKKNSNPFLLFKNFMVERIEKYQNNAYLYAFLLGDTSYIPDNVIESYRNNGISHDKPCEKVM